MCYLWLNQTPAYPSNEYSNRTHASYPDTLHRRHNIYGYHSPSRGPLHASLRHRKFRQLCSGQPIGADVHVHLHIQLTLVASSSTMVACWAADQQVVYLAAIYLRLGLNIYYSKEKKMGCGTHTCWYYKTDIEQ